MTDKSEDQQHFKAPTPLTEEDLSDSRREFLKNVLAGTVGATVLMVTGPGGAAMRRGMLPEGENIPTAEHHWEYVVDINNCIGCGNCVRACKRENNVPDTVFRTWVERYILTNEGVYVESPNGSLDGFEQVNSELKEKTDAMLIDCGEVPESYLGKIEKVKPERIIIVDAVHMDKPPGTIQIIDTKKIKGVVMSSHNIPMTLFLEYIDTRLKCETIFLGIQPKAIEFNSDLSSECRDAISKAADEVLNLIKQE